MKRKKSVGHAFWAYWRRTENGTEGKDIDAVTVGRKRKASSEGGGNKGIFGFDMFGIGKRYNSSRTLVRDANGGSDNDLMRLLFAVSFSIRNRSSASPM